MGNDRMTHDDRVLLLLFPFRKLGEKIAEQFVLRNYTVILFTLSEKEEHYFSTLEKLSEKSFTVVRLETPISNLFLEKVPSPIRNATLKANAIIHFMGTDFLHLNIQNSGEEWKINHTETVQVKFAFIETMLNNFTSGKKTIWINLVHGSHIQSGNGEIFCNTRYGITGFIKIFEITPNLQNIEVLNICLTYFRKPHKQNETAHCPHCVTKSFLDQGYSIEGEKDIPELLIKIVEEKSL